MSGQTATRGGLKKPQRGWAPGQKVIVRTCLSFKTPQYRSEAFSRASSLRSAQLAGFHSAGLHGRGEHVVDLGPGRTHLRRALFAEALFEGPQ